MDSYFAPVALGVICIFLGIMNMRGNISSLHWYHRQRVSDEDILPFGKKIGFGTIVIGLSLIIFGGCSFATKTLNNNIFMLIGSILLILGIVVGIVLSFYAMIKYNKGIF